MDKDYLRKTVFALKAIADARDGRTSRVGLHSILALFCLGLKDGLEPAELRRACEITAAAATCAIDGLERIGFAKRSRHATDRRKVVVTLTDKGREALG